MASDLRCQNHLWAIVVDGLIEIRCRYCAKHSHAVVFHYFDPTSGRLVKTETYADPAKQVRIKSARRHNNRKD